MNTLSVDLGSFSKLNCMDKSCVDMQGKVPLICGLHKQIMRLAFAKKIYDIKTIKLLTGLFLLSKQRHLFDCFS